MTNSEIDETMDMLANALQFYGRLLAETRKMAEQAKKANEVSE